jgi:hypothetical protein
VTLLAVVLGALLLPLGLETLEAVILTPVGAAWLGAWSGVVVVPMVGLETGLLGVLGLVAGVFGLETDVLGVVTGLAGLFGGGLLELGLVTLEADSSDIKHFSSWKINITLLRFYHEHHFC